MTVSMNLQGSCQVLINACYAIMSMFNSVNQCILCAGVSSYKVVTLTLSVNKCLWRSDCHSKLVRGKSHTITINRIHIARSVAIIIMSESIDAINMPYGHNQLGPGPYHVLIFTSYCIITYHYVTNWHRRSVANLGLLVMVYYHQH